MDQAWPWRCLTAERLRLGISARVPFRMRSVLAFLVIALALTVPSAYASPSVRYSSNGGTLYPGPLNDIGSGYRSISLDDVTNATILRDVVDATIDGQRAGMAVRRSIPLAGALALGARALGPLGTAAALYDLYKGLRCTSSPSGFALSCDDGVAPTSPTVTSGWTHTGSTTVWATAEQACRSLITRSPGYTYRYVSGEYCVGTSPTGVETIMGYVSRASCPSGGCSGVLVSCPAGSVLSAVDGRCSGGTVSSLTPEQAASRALPYADPKKAPDAVRDALRQGIDAAPYAQPLPAVGPSSLSGPAKTTTNSAGQSITESTTYNITYSGDSYTYNITNTTTNNTTGETTTTTQQPKTECGVAGKPPCAVKVDEEGTPVWQDRDGSGLDALKAAEAAKRDELMGQVPQPDLGWFGAPPLAECAPFEFPNNMGSLNPCGVVGQTREVMAYLWALVAAWLSFGMIRKAATGGS